jgi:hypothetical protein
MNQFYVSSLKSPLIAILLASSHSLVHISVELGPFSCQGSVTPLYEPNNNIFALKDAQGFDLGDPNLLQKNPDPKGQFWLITMTYASIFVHFRVGKFSLPAHFSHFLLN